LHERGIEVDIRKYLEDRPTLAELHEVQQKLAVAAIAMMRPKEKVFAEMGLNRDMDDAALIAAMAQEPRLIERPILIAGDKAALGRPPEAVLALL
jgi:arsenate reductase